MRLNRIILLLSLCFLVVLSGCFKKTTPQALDNELVQKGTLVFNFKPNGSILNRSINSKLIPVEAQKIRVRVFNSKDWVVNDCYIQHTGTQTTSVTMPAGTYSVQAFAIQSTGEILTSGVANNVVILANQVGTCNITLSRPTFNVNAYKDTTTNVVNTVYGGDTFNIGSTYDLKGIETETTVKLNTFLGGVADIVGGTYDSDNSIQLTAPSVQSPTTFTYQIKKTLPESKYTNSPILYYLFPSATCGETLSSVQVIKGEGGLTINLN